MKKIGVWLSAIGLVSIFSLHNVQAEFPSAPWITQNQCSSFDPTSGMLHIPCLDLGSFYWLDLSLAESNSLSFRIDNFGMETDCVGSAASFDLISNRIHVPCLNLGDLPTYWMDFTVGLGADNNIGCDLNGFGENQLLSEADNGRAIVLSNGSMMTVRLSANPTTGYQWSIGNFDQGIMEEVGHAYVQDPTCCSGCVGCGGNEIWTFRGVSPGLTRIEMTYARPWEGQASGGRFMLDVQVQ